MYFTAIYWISPFDLFYMFYCNSCNESRRPHNLYCFHHLTNLLHPYKRLQLSINWSERCMKLTINGVFSLFLSLCALVTFLLEGVVLGFWNFANKWDLPPPGVDGLLSGGSSVRRPGSEDPHQRQQIFYHCWHWATIKLENIIFQNYHWWDNSTQDRVNGHGYTRGVSSEF